MLAAALGLSAALRDIHGCICQALFGLVLLEAPGGEASGPICLILSQLRGSQLQIPTPTLDSLFYVLRTPIAISASQNVFLRVVENVYFMTSFSMRNEQNMKMLIDIFLQFKSVYFFKRALMPDSLLEPAFVPEQMNF